MRHQRVVTFVAALGFGLAGSASAGTSLVKSWREPSAGTLNFQKMLVLVIAPHESQMHFGEAVLVGLMKRTQGVSAHAVLPKDDARDEQKMRAYMAQEAFDGAVTLRLLATGQETAQMAGLYAPAHTGFWSYYSYAWPMVWDPGYVQTQRVMHMETQVYSMKDDKVVWAGITKTTNPKTARKLVEDVAKAVGGDLRKLRLIQ